MSRIPRPRPNDLIRALKRNGFEVIRIKGSHHVLRHEDGRTVVVPVHSEGVIGPGLMREILKQSELTLDQLGKF